MRDVPFHLQMKAENFLCKAIYRQRINTVILKNPASSTIHTATINSLKKPLSSSVNNLLVYTYTSGPRCISVQLQSGMSQLAVAADESSPGVSPGTGAPSS